MALSKLQKGLTGLFIAFIAVIAIGYGGMRYLENAVVEAIRTWAANTPKNAHVELGDVTYTLLENHLVLKNIRADIVGVDGQTRVVSLETLDVQNPGTTFLSLMRDPNSEIKEAEIPVADAVTLTGVSAGPDPLTTVGSRSFKNIRVEAAPVKALLQNASGTDAVRAARMLVYALSYSEGLALDVSATGKELPYTVKARQSREVNYAKGHLDSSSVTGISLSVRDKEVLSIAEAGVENINLPPREVFEKLISAKPDISDEEALALLREVFGGPRPLLGALHLNDIKSQNSLLGLSIAKVTFANPSTDPFSFDVTVEHAKAPASLIPQLQLLSIMGVKDLDASAAFSLSLPAKDGAFTSSGSLSLAELGTADMAFKGVMPREALDKVFQMSVKAATPAEDEAIERFMDENLKFTRIEIGYADEGLLPRLGLIGQQLMGLTTDQCIALAKQYVRENAGQAASGEGMPKLMDFIDRPGAVRIIFDSSKPMTADEIETASGDSPLFKLEVSPGPKTAQELISELMKK